MSEEKLKLKFLDMSPLQDLYFIVRGFPKVGKTYLLGQALAIPELCPVLWCSLDNSHGTLTTEIYQKTVGITDLHKSGKFTAIDSLKTFKDTLAAVKQGIPLIDGKPCRTLVLDNLTEFIDRLLRLEAEKDDPTKARARALDDTAGQGDYRVVKGLMSDILHTVRYELRGVHVLATADIRVDTLKLDGADRSRIEIGVPPGLIAKVNRSFDVNGELSVKGGKRVIRFNQDAIVQGLGDRYMRLPAQIEDPTLRKILTTTGHLKGTT